MVVLILAAILPDFDGVFYFIFSGVKNPVFFHGGITHTLLIGILMSTILTIVYFGILKWKGHKMGFKTLIRFIILGLFGIFLHLLIDINTISNEYGLEHHLYFWPFSNVSFHFDILFAHIFPRFPYFDFSKFMLLWFSPVSFNIVTMLSLIINGLFFVVFIYDFAPPRKNFPWDSFIYSDDRKRDFYISDHLELFLNISLLLIFIGIFVIRIGNLFTSLLGML